jgi:hypothetical protein
VCDTVGNDMLPVLNAPPLATRVYSFAVGAVAGATHAEVPDAS